jgi:hypothetical protein
LPKRSSIVLMRLSPGYPTPADERVILNNLRREHPINRSACAVDHRRVQRPGNSQEVIPAVALQEDKVRKGRLLSDVALQREIWR